MNTQIVNEVENEVEMDLLAKKEFAMNNIAYNCANYVYSYMEVSEREDYLSDKESLHHLIEEYDQDLLDLVINEYDDELVFDLDDEGDVGIIDDIFTMAVAEMVELLEEDLGV